MFCKCARVQCGCSTEFLIIFTTLYSSLYLVDYCIIKHPEINVIEEFEQVNISLLDSAVDMPLSYSCLPGR